MNTFRKTSRLLNKGDFDHVFQKPNRIYSPALVVLCRCNEKMGPRLGFALSKKQVAKAHDRNRIRRIVREAFRQQKLPAVDLIVLARPGVSGVNNKLLVAQLNGIWDKILPLCNKSFVQ